MFVTVPVGSLGCDLLLSIFWFKFCGCAVDLWWVFCCGGAAFGVFVSLGCLRCLFLIDWCVVWLCWFA